MEREHIMRREVQGLGRLHEEGEEGKIKRTRVRELADPQRSRNLCLHIGF